MARCAVLQKWHWEILEENSASVSACSVVRGCRQPCSVTLLLCSSSLFCCSSLVSPALSYPLWLRSSFLISLSVFLVAFIFPYCLLLIFFFKWLYLTSVVLLCHFLLSLSIQNLQSVLGYLTCWLLLDLNETFALKLQQVSGPPQQPVTTVSATSDYCYSRLSFESFLLVLKHPHSF